VVQSFHPFRFLQFFTASGLQIGAQFKELADVVAACFRAATRVFRDPVELQLKRPRARMAEMKASIDLLGSDANRSPAAGDFIRSIRKLRKSLRISHQAASVHVAPQ